MSPIPDIEMLICIIHVCMWVLGKDALEGGFYIQFSLQFIVLTDNDEGRGLFRTSLHSDVVVAINLIFFRDSS